MNFRRVLKKIIKILPLFLLGGAFNISFSANHFIPSTPIILEDDYKTQEIIILQFLEFENQVSVYPSSYKDRVNGVILLDSQSNPFTIQLRWTDEGCDDIIFSSHNNILFSQDKDIETHFTLSKIYGKDQETIAQCVDGGHPISLEWATLVNPTSAPVIDWSTYNSIQITLHNWNSEDDSQQWAYVLRVHDIKQINIEGEYVIYEIRNSDLGLVEKNSIGNLDNKDAILVFSPKALPDATVGYRVARILRNVFKDFQNLEVYLVVNKGNNNNPLGIILSDSEDQDGWFEGGVWVYSPLIQFYKEDTNYKEPTLDYSVYYTHNLTWRSCYTHTYNDEYYSERSAPCVTKESDIRNNYDSLNYWGRKFINENKIYTINLDGSIQDGGNVKAINALNVGEGKDVLILKYVVENCTSPMFGDMCVLDRINDLDFYNKMSHYSPIFLLNSYGRYESHNIFLGYNPIYVNLWSYFENYYAEDQIYYVGLPLPYNISSSIKTADYSLRINDNLYLSSLQRPILHLTNNPDLEKYDVLYFYSLSKDGKDYTLLAYNEESKKIQKIRVNNNEVQILEEQSVEDVINELGGVDYIGTFLKGDSLAIVFQANNKAKIVYYPIS